VRNPSTAGRHLVDGLGIVGDGEHIAGCRPWSTLNRAAGPNRLVPDKTELIRAFRHVTSTRSEVIPAFPAESDPSSPAPRLPHIRSLDGLRGVAVLAVVLYHFAPSLVPGGFLGVDLFFVLSGFLIGGLLFSEYQRRQKIGLRQFYIRRAVKIWPSYLLFLAT
jgi:hypothetical protein